MTFAWKESNENYAGPCLDTLFRSRFLEFRNLDPHSQYVLEEKLCDGNFFTFIRLIDLPMNFSGCM